MYITYNLSFFQSLRSNSYDHHAAIYLLLLERLKHRTQDGSGATTGTGGANTGSTGGSQRRRPSSVAEQAIARKGGPSVALTNPSSLHHDQPSRRSSEHAHRYLFYLM